MYVIVVLIITCKLCFCYCMGTYLVCLYDRMQALMKCKAMVNNNFAEWIIKLKNQCKHGHSTKFDKRLKGVIKIYIFTSIATTWLVIETDDDDNDK